MERGDYVLATKYQDGDPGDQWCVGFYDRLCKDRHIVVDSNGRPFRANGFRRVAKISAERGKFILDNKDFIQQNIRSLWWWKRCSMEKAVKDIAAIRHGTGIGR